MMEANEQEDDYRLMMPALQALRTFIRTSTSSMTSVPKPLKFLRPFYEELGKIRRVWHASMVEERVSFISGVHRAERGFWIEV
jgi:26S proteasome regulatory subunit N1